MHCSTRDGLCDTTQSTGAESYHLPCCALCWRLRRKSPIQHKLELGGNHKTPRQAWRPKINQHLPLGRSLYKANLGWAETAYSLPRPSDPTTPKSHHDAKSIDDDNQREGAIQRQPGLGGNRELLAQREKMQLPLATDRDLAATLNS